MKKIYYYPTCGTCKKALKWLDENKVKYEKKHIVEETPNIEELMEIYKKSNLELKKFFNTSGNVYKEMNLKDKLKNMSNEEVDQYVKEMCNKFGISQSLFDKLKDRFGK